MSNLSNAWLIEASGGHKFAIAEYELIEYVMEPERIEIPLAADYASSILLWQEHMVPVLDFNSLINKQIISSPSISIIAYQTTPGEDLEYIGIELQQAPTKITISDEQASEPEDFDKGIWQLLSNSWFTHQQQSIPIINISLLASAELNEQLQKLIAPAPAPALLKAV